MKHAEEYDWSDMGFAPPNITREISLGPSMWWIKKVHGHATSGRSVRPHKVIRYSIEKVLNSPWMTNISHGVQPDVVRQRENTQAGRRLDRKSVV